MEQFMGLRDYSITYSSIGVFPFRLNVITIFLMLPSSFTNWVWTALLQTMAPSEMLKEFWAVVVI